METEKPDEQVVPVDGQQVASEQVVVTPGPEEKPLSAEEKADAAGQVPPVPPVPPEVKPTMVVQFAGADSALFDVRFVGFQSASITPQLMAVIGWLQARCNFILTMSFEQQFAGDLAQQQLRGEALKGLRKQGPAGSPQIIVPPPGTRVPQRPK